MMIPATMDDAMANGPGFESADDVARRDVGDRPGLPYVNAFVVQFTAETDARLEHARVHGLAARRRVDEASRGAGRGPESEGRARHRRGAAVAMTAPDCRRLSGPRTTGCRRPNWNRDWGALSPIEMVPVVTTYKKSNG
jgi:hypothetical protein